MKPMEAERGSRGAGWLPALPARRGPRGHAGGAERTLALVDPHTSRHSQEWTLAGVAPGTIVPWPRGSFPLRLLGGASSTRWSLRADDVQPGGFWMVSSRPSVRRDARWPVHLSPRRCRRAMRDGLSVHLCVRLPGGARSGMESGCGAHHALQCAMTGDLARPPGTCVCMHACPSVCVRTRVCPPALRTQMSSSGRTWQPSWGRAQGCHLKASTALTTDNFCQHPRGTKTCPAGFWGGFAPLAGDAESASVSPLVPWAVADGRDSHRGWIRLYVPPARCFAR